MRTFDDTYVQALSNRDPHVENDVISFFTKSVKIRLRTQLRSHQAVEDACQETLLRVFAYFRAGNMLRTSGSFFGFVHSVCGNVAMEMVRADARVKELTGNAPDPVDPRADPERRMIAEERNQSVRRVLKELRAKDQQLLRRVCLEEEDKDKVCAEFGITRDYLRLLLHLARLRFRPLVEMGSICQPVARAQGNGGRANRRADL